MKIDKLLSQKPEFPELRGSLAGMRFPCFGEIKYDGEAVYVHYKRGAWINTVNKYGTRRSDWHKLDMIARNLENAGVKYAILQGELFWGLGKAGALYELLKHKADDDLNIKLFDMPYLFANDSDNIDGEKVSLIDRVERMHEIFANEPDWMVAPIIINNQDEAIDYFEELTSLGYEGLVLKSLDGFHCNGPCSWVKMKKKDRSNYEIAYVDPVKERIEIWAPVPPNAKIRVGVKCPNKSKKRLGLKAGDIVAIEHQGVLPSGSLRHPVFLGIPGPIGEE